MPTILWIDDNPNTVAEQIDEVQQAGFKVIIRDKAHTIKEMLDTKPINAIIVDVMLYGVNDLKSINVFQISTKQGRDAGWALLEHLIWTSDSKYRQVPVLILSGRPNDEYQRHQMKRVCDECGIKEQPLYIEKGEFNWIQKFSEWLKKIQ